jgi:hypothetical protein
MVQEIQGLVLQYQQQKAKLVNLLIDEDHSQQELCQMTLTELRGLAWSRLGELLGAE